MKQLTGLDIQWFKAACERQVILVLVGKRAMQLGLDPDPAVCEAYQRFRQPDRNQEQQHQRCPFTPAPPLWQLPSKAQQSTDCDTAFHNAHPKTMMACCTRTTSECQTRDGDSIWYTGERLEEDAQLL